jgi:hypothetical protein
LSWGSRIGDVSGPGDGQQDLNAAVGGSMRDFPTPCKGIDKIVQWRAIQNKTANPYVIEMTM